MLQYPNGRGHSPKNYASVGSSPTWSTLCSHGEMAATTALKAVDFGRVGSNPTVSTCFI